MFIVKTGEALITSKRRRFELWRGLGEPVFIGYGRNTWKEYWGYGSRLVVKFTLVWGRYIEKKVSKTE